MRIQRISSELQTNEIDMKYLIITEMIDRKKYSSFMSFQFISFYIVSFASLFVLLNDDKNMLKLDFKRLLEFTGEIR